MMSGHRFGPRTDDRGRHQGVVVTGGGGAWVGGYHQRVGPNPLTPAEGRRYRAETRFPVGNGVRLRGLNPDRPIAGAAVVIVDADRRPRVIAVLTDAGQRPRDQLFALWTPSLTFGGPAKQTRSLTEMQEQSWRLVEAGLTWNDVDDIISHSTIAGRSAFEPDYLIVNPTNGQPVSMMTFDAPAPPAPQAPPPLNRREPQGYPGAEVRGIEDLSTAVEVLASIKQAYAAYECDYQRVLAAPALSDVTEDATGAFVEAFNLAVALEPEWPERCPPGHAARFVSLVTAAEAAWETAEAHAIRLGIAGYDPAQRAQIRRARQALDLALRADTPAGEREASLNAARRLLDGLVTLPAPLETVISRAVTARPTTRRALE